MKKLIIFGTKNFAEMSHYFFTNDSEYEVAGFTIDGEFMSESSFKGLPVIAYEDIRKEFPPEKYEIFNAMGVTKINTLRAEKTEEILNYGYKAASFISSTATIYKGFIRKPNMMIMDHVNIHPMVDIGYNTVIWSNSRIALKANIGNHCWITSAVIGDSSYIGDYSFVGLNATIAPYVNVGTHNLIGAGALILKDTKNYSVYKGTRSKPSKVSSLRLRNYSIIQ